MQRKKTNKVENILELRYKMAEKMAEFEDGEISVADAKVYVGFGTVILKSLVVEAVRDQFVGVTRSIDFLDYKQQNVDKEKGLGEDAFLEDSKKHPITGY